MSLPEAILAMVADAVPGVEVHDSRVPTHPPQQAPPERYVVVWIDDGLRRAGQVAPASTAREFRWQVSCVAAGRAMAAWLAGQVADALVDARPVADGWDPGLIEHTFTARPRADEQVQQHPRVVAVDHYLLLAEQLSTAQS